MRRRSYPRPADRRGNPASSPIWLGRRGERRIEIVHEPEPVVFGSIERRARIGKREHVRRLTRRSAEQMRSSVPTTAFAHHSFALPAVSGADRAQAGMAADGRRSLAVQIAERCEVRRLGDSRRPHPVIDGREDFAPRISRTRWPCTSSRRSRDSRPDLRDTCRRPTSPALDDRCGRASPPWPAPTSGSRPPALHKGAGPGPAFRVAAGIEEGFVLVIGDLEPIDQHTPRPGRCAR